MCNRSNYVIHNMRGNNSLGSYLIKYSRLYSTFSKAMNKIKSTKERIFISLVGPSGFGKSLLIFDWLKIGTFQPAFDKIFHFYQHYQPLYSQMQRKNLKFIQGVDFDLIENLPNNDQETQKFKARQNRVRTFENMVMSYFQATRPECKIESYYTTGKQKKN